MTPHPSTALTHFSLLYYTTLHYTTPLHSTRCPPARLNTAFPHGFNTSGHTVRRNATALDVTHHHTRPYGSPRFTHLISPRRTTGRDAARCGTMRPDGTLHCIDFGRSPVHSTTSHNTWHFIAISFSFHHATASSFPSIIPAHPAARRRGTPQTRAPAVDMSMCR
jgi:hypothetical protein